MQHISALLNHIGIVGLLLALAVIFAGAMVQASIGIGLNLFSVGLLVLIDPVFAPGPVLVHSFLLSLIASVGLRRDIRVGELALSIAGVAIGTVLAALLLALVPREGLPQILGGLIVLAVLITAAGLRVAISTGTVLAATAAAGVMGTIAGAHGAPVALLYQREAPSRVRAALLPFFTIANPLAITALAWAGLFGWREFWASVVLVPALIAGYLAAPLLIRILSPPVIRAALLAISAASGLMLVFKG
jgi:uncharacterized membrane protein YfcA